MQSFSGSQALQARKAAAPGTARRTPCRRRWRPWRCAARPRLGRAGQTRPTLRRGAAAGGRHLAACPSPGLCSTTSDSGFKVSCLGSASDLTGIHVGHIEQHVPHQACNMITQHQASLSCVWIEGRESSLTSLAGGHVWQHVHHQACAVQLGVQDFGVWGLGARSQAPGQHSAAWSWVAACPSSVQLKSRGARSQGCKETTRIGHSWQQVPYQASPGLWSARSRADVRERDTSLTSGLVSTSSPGAASSLRDHWAKWYLAASQEASLWLC